VTAPDLPQKVVRVPGDYPNAQDAFDAHIADRTPVTIIIAKGPHAFIAAKDVDAGHMTLIYEGVWG
jgi:hypothetical protein